MFIVFPGCRHFSFFQFFVLLFTVALYRGIYYRVIEQKAGNVNWQEVNTLLRPGVVRMFTYQLVSRGACGVLYFLWRQARIGSEKFYGGVLTHDGRGENRVYQEIREIGLALDLRTHGCLHRAPRL